MLMVRSRGYFGMLGKSDKGGKMVTDQAKLFCGRRSILFILQRGDRPTAHTPISVIIALAKAGHCPLSLSVPEPDLQKLYL